MIWVRFQVFVVAVFTLRPRTVWREVLEEIGDFLDSLRFFVRQSSLRCLARFHSFFVISENARPGLSMDFSQFDEELISSAKTNSRTFEDTCEVLNWLAERDESLRSAVSSWSQPHARNRVNVEKPNRIENDGFAVFALAGARDLECGPVFSLNKRYSVDCSLETSFWAPGQAKSLRSSLIDFRGPSPAHTRAWYQWHPHFVFPNTRWVIWLSGPGWDLSGLLKFFEEFRYSQLPVKRVVQSSRCPRWRGIGESDAVFFDLKNPGLYPILKAIWRKVESVPAHRVNKVYQTLEAQLIELAARGIPGRSVGEEHGVFQFRKTIPDTRVDLSSLPGAIPSSRCGNGFDGKYGEHPDMKLYFGENPSWGEESLLIDVIVPVHNGVGFVRPCLNALLRSSIGHRTRLLVVDDSSEEETARFLERFCELNDSAELFRTNRQLGFSGSVNRGLAAASGDLVCVINSDTLVPENFWSKMVAALHEKPGVGMVGPLSNAAGYQTFPYRPAKFTERMAGQGPIHSVNAAEQMMVMNTLLEKSYSGFPVRVSLLHGFCFALKKAVIDSVGLLDELSFPDGLGVEDDLSFRVVNSGWSLAIASDTYVWHGKSMSSSKPGRRLATEAGRQKVIDIYGYRRRRNAALASHLTAKHITRSVR